MEMRHPFDLDLAELTALDLDFEEPLTDEEAAQVGGGLSIFTLPGKESGGGCLPPKPLPKPIDPPIFTTLALGEEGGCGEPPPVTTDACGEEGGGEPIEIHPPEVTTLALGEEGGICY